MKQKITFRDLLNLISEGKQPNKVHLSGTNIKWEWDSLKGEYYLRNFNGYSEIETLQEMVCELYTTEQLAEEKIIYYFYEVLDDKEKEYLSNVIKPFKKCVKYITKREAEGREKILICYKDFFDMKNDNEMRMEYTFIWLPTDYTFIWLPTFKKGTMYRGMELNKEYTLEELGL